MSSDTQGDDGDGSKSTRKRVNISIYPDLHDDCTEYADNHGKSFSQLVRDALLKEIDPAQSDSSAALHQQVLKRLESMEGKIENTQQSVDEVRDRLVNLSTTTGLELETVADAIVEVLENAEGSLTVPEIVGRVEFQPNQVKQALEKLDRQFVIVRVGVQSETEDTQWKLV